MQPMKLRPMTPADRFEVAELIYVSAASFDLATFDRAEGAI